MTPAEIEEARRLNREAMAEIARRTEQIEAAYRVNTFVYVHRAADGAPLYVGCTAMPDERTNAHRRLAHWFSDVASIDWDGPYLREEALALEKATIAALLPVHNVRHKPKAAA